MAAKGARVHIYGDWDGAGVKKAQQDLSTFQRQAQGFSGAISKSMLGVGAAFGGAFAIGKVVDFFQQAAAAAMEDQKSVVALSQALANLGLAHANAGVEEFIGDMQMAYGVADSDLRGAYQRLVTATGDVAQAQDLLTLSQNIAAATGKDLASVSQALAKASMGNVAALTRLGVPIAANTVKTKDFAGAVEQLTAKFQGQADAAAQTYAGRMARLQQGMDELKESIGYGVLDALDSLSEALGGDDGAMSLMEDLSEAARGAGIGVGYLIDYFALIPKAISGAFGGSEGASSQFSDLAVQIALTGSQLNNFGLVIDGVRAVMDNTSDSYYRMVTLLTEAEMGYRDASGAVHTWKDGVETVTPALTAQQIATEDATEALSFMNDEIKAYMGLISSSQSLDDFRKKMADLGETLEGNRRSFVGLSDGAKENRDTLRSALGDAARVVQDMVDTGKISAAEYDATFAGMRKSIIDGFVKRGFKRKDVVAFLNSDGIWGSVITATGAGAEDDAVAAGRRLGKSLADGVAKGLVNPTSLRGLQASGERLIALAEYYMEQASDSHSPSRRFAEVGKDIADGVAVGIKDKTPAVVKAAADLIGQAAKAAGDSARESVTSGLGAVQSISDSVLSTVLGGIRLSTSGADGAALTPEQMVSALFGDIAAQRQAVSMLAASVGDTLPPELLQQFLSAGPQVAQSLAGLFARNPALAEQLALAYDELGVFTQEALGIPMGLAWGKVGEDSAREMLLNARGTLAARAEGFARWVYNNLAVTIPVDVALRNVPGRANGGPVAEGAPYMVGERGPELFVPSVSGTIVPNDRMRSGAAVNVTVNAGMGADGYQIGQQVVEAIKKYERVAGPVFQAA